jgi:hypothetical protein
MKTNLSFLIACCVCLLGLATSPTYAEEINIVQLDRYSGTIGTHSVSVLLGSAKGVVVGRYSYGTHVSKGQALELSGKPVAEQWTLQETAASSRDKAKVAVTGQWQIALHGTEWGGTWTKPDGTGALSVSLKLEHEAADYAVAKLAGATASKEGCIINVYRHQRKVETIDASVEDAQGCERSEFSFPDLNFDGYADLMFPADSPLHNISYRLMLYNPKTARFEAAGELTQPSADPVHKNIAVFIHYGAAKHGAQIYRFLPGKNEPTLIKDMQPCSERTPQEKAKTTSCAENYFYDEKSGKIVEGDEN